MLPYAELHTHSCFSLLDATDTPQDLVSRAAELGLSALALTDHNAVYGVIPFIHAAKKYGLPSILGTELTLESNVHLTLLVENEIGWHNLCYLISLAQHNAVKGKAVLPFSELQTHAQGLIALSGCRHGEIAQAVQAGRYNDAVTAAQRYLRCFGNGNFWIELQSHSLPHEKRFLHDLVALATYLKIGYVATNNVHYIHPEKHQLQDILVCIQNKTPIDAARKFRRPTTEYYLKSPQEMAKRFAEYPNAITNTLTIAELCQFELRYGLQDLPIHPTPNQQSSELHLRSLCEEALGNMHRADQNEAENLLHHELGIIGRSGLANYFLIVADIVRFSHDKGILCQGRGSAANSLVAHLLGISPVDPLTHHLVFERFLSDERVSVPDIDIDFQADRREEVIQYTYQKYGTAYCAMACTFVTYRSRMAIRDIGKALGLPATLLEEAALSIDRGDSIPATSKYAQLLATLVDQILGLPRHLGIHNGGMIVMGQPLDERLPTEPATMPDRMVVQWDKTMLEEAGIVKIDLLGLRMLSAIGEAVTIVGNKTGAKPDLAHLTFDDPSLYDMMVKSDTVGVFQVESRAQAQTLPRLKPKTFNDLIVSISLIRPGPIQGNMVHPYLRRRSGTEAIQYPHLKLEAALEETMGVILFQEQTIKVARDLAGFSAGQGEMLRRALGGKRPEKEVEKLRETFIAGAIANDVLPDIAENVFESLKAFGGYSFPKSHAAAFAVLVYHSAWLKYYHPAPFYTALLNHQPMGFWTPAVIVNDARRHAIGIARVDINRSVGSCQVEETSIRIGLRYIDAIGTANIKKIEMARQENGEFRDLFDFCQRTKLPVRATENLILVGAMDEWGIDRRILLWEFGKIGRYENQLGLQFASDDIALRPLSKVELLALEMQVMGLSTGEHIMSFFQDWMQKRKVLGSQAVQTVRPGQVVRIAGETVMHQAPPTAKGYHFLTLEDKDGMINVIVRPSVYKAYRHVIRHAPLLWVTGTVQREGDVTNIICESASVLPQLKG